MSVFFVMGVCTSQAERGFTIAHSPPIDAIPPDTAYLKNANLPVLAFYVLISDLKLKKCPYVHLHIFRN